MAVPIAKIGVVGAGQMGAGIAHVCALAGYDVMLTDIGDAPLEVGLAAIGANMARQATSGRISDEERTGALARIKTSTDPRALADADLVVETVTEDEEIKRAVYTAICPLLKPEAIIATNSSTLSITRLAAATDRADRFLGIHFMNPVPVMELVEIIRGIATSAETFETAKTFVTELGKSYAVTEDFPAFIVNRILMPMINEGIYALHEGVGSVEAIDMAMRLGAHHPMGPLQLADFVGLDTCLAVMQALYDGLADSKYRPCPLLVKYVEAGWLGRKSGRGFYDYHGDTPVPTR
jgi:3-hydroxybutyryl-CoA dehydrogenase